MKFASETGHVTGPSEFFSLVSTVNHFFFGGDYFKRKHFYLEEPQLFGGLVSLHVFLKMT